jgi:hypothetical protein
MSRSVFLASCVALALLLSAESAVLFGKVATAFKATEVSLTAEPDDYSGPGPALIKFTGKITANGPGTVKYTFPRSDGARGPTFTVTFEKFGTKEVSTSWQLGGKYEGWQTLKVVAPNEVVSEKATFKVDCKK